MRNSTQTRYRLRNKLRQMLGDFSESELILQIKKGRLTGEEEVAEPPYQRWKKVSTIPVFYDALVAAALGVQHTPPEEPEVSEAALPEHDENQLFSPMDHDTHHGKILADENRTVRQEPEHFGATEQIHQSVAEIPDSEIDDLFSEVDSVKVPIETELRTPPESVPSAPRSSESPRNQESNKRPLMWGATILVLGVLFFFGSQNPTPPKIETTSSADDSLGADPADESVFYEKSAKQALEVDTSIGYETGVDLFLKSIKAKPNDLALYDGLTLCLARTIENKPDSSKYRNLLAEYLKKGREQELHRSSFYRAEAIAEKALGQVEKARTLLDQALETDSLNPGNLLIQAEWMIESGQHQEAQALLSSITQWNEQRVRAHFLLANAFFRSREFEKTWAQVQKIVELNPTHAASYALLGDLFTEKNDLKSAKAFYDLSAKLSYAASAETAGYVLWRAGNLSEVGSDRALSKSYYSLSYHYSEEHRDAIKEKLGYIPSEEQIKASGAEVLGDPAYIQRVGQDAMDAGNYYRAEAFYLLGTWAYPKVAKFWLRLGEARERKARSRDEFRWAAMTYLKATKIAPEEIEPYIKLGLLETEQSNLDRAFEFLQRAQNLAPEDPNVELALGKHYFARKDFRSAEQRFRTARRLNPTNSEVSYYQGVLYKLFDASNPKAAMRHFEEAYSKDPNNYDALAEWLKLKVITFEKIFAVKFLRNMVASDPNNPALLWVFGEVFSANQEFNRAVQYYQRALDLDRFQSKYRLSLAKSLASLGRLDEAIAEYKLAADLDAKNGEGYYYAAELLYQIRSYDAAREILLGLLKVIPSYPGARRLLAMSYQAKGEKDQAIEQFAKEVKANPMNYQFQLEYVELLMTNEKHKEAVKELNRIVQLPLEQTVKDSRSPSGYRKEPTGLKGYRLKGLLLLSRCYRKMEKLEVAEGAVKSGLSIDPENLDLRLERGMVYAALGRFREAAEDFNYFLSKNDKSPEAATVRAILKKTIIEE